VDTILITDDNNYNIQVLIGILGDEKYRFLVALSGEESLFIAQTALPDLIRAAGSDSAGYSDAEDGWF